MRFIHNQNEIHIQPKCDSKIDSYSTKMRFIYNQNEIQKLIHIQPRWDSYTTKMIYIESYTTKMIYIESSTTKMIYIESSTTKMRFIYNQNDLHWVIYNHCKMTPRSHMPKVLRAHFAMIFRLLISGGSEYSIHKWKRVIIHVDAISPTVINEHSCISDKKTATSSRRHATWYLFIRLD